MTWHEGRIKDCQIIPIRKFEDNRGWLAELFRTDELQIDLHPAMAYLSETGPHVVRGPHEHRDQTDLFAFIAGKVKLYLWDARSNSSTYGIRSIIEVGEENPVIAIVPPGIVHAYQNLADSPVLILNFPNRLYAGPGRTEPVDEIRHEDQTDSPYQLD